MQSRSVLSADLRAAGCAVFFCLAAPSAQAQDALYPDPPPPDAVFVRWLGTPAEGEAVRRFMGVEIPAGTVEEAAYAAVSASLLDGANPGSFYTVLSSPEQPPRIVAEPPRPDRSKVHLLLMSCEAGPVQLEVPEGGPVVIAPVAPYTAGSRAVNPVAAPLAVRNSASGALLGSFDLQLSRGRNLTFLACGGAVELVEHRFHGSLGAG